MSKKQNDLFVVILFSIMRIRHPIYPQENAVVVNSSFISTQKNAFEFLESTQYIELLKKEEILRNQETSLFNENREEYLKLLSYGVILKNQTYYNRKVEYIFLVEEYLRENASKDEARLFVSEFFNIFKKNNKALEILEQGIKRLATFCIDPKSTEFSAPINQTVGLC